MNKEEKARELYPVKNQHVPTIGGRTAYIDVNEKARNAFLKGVECANQQPEVEKPTGRITVSYFRKVYKQFIDERISMTKMLELLTEQAHRTDVCKLCQRQLDGTNVSKTKCNACFSSRA